MNAKLFVKVQPQKNRFRSFEIWESYPETHCHTMPSFPNRHSLQALAAARSLAGLSIAPLTTLPRWSWNSWGCRSPQKRNCPRACAEVLASESSGSDHCPWSLGYTDRGDQKVQQELKQVGFEGGLLHQQIPYLYLYAIIYIYLDVWMYGCMDVWMYGCMDVYIYIIIHSIYNIS